ncbi:GNAT family N-acetyltransferase [Aliiglaciecola sp. 3_MG-2023]|uniref:GNAT family N-acetyltransferase n=1 Tax=Aliiglaciecola sp. 3_MG-2023 TaxID=3062644 RepID=UPI0026E1A40A|nr:GNAT family N-acetyltransferase [Aliiglaciecola sp. 3_MG-2023]MDO6692679.1 GNAT family N-acetyltransferase [Aliiglaciecola sp. 3_MG-2023]
MSITFSPISSGSANYIEVIDLYKEAFPEARKVPKWFLKYTLRNGKVGFSALYAEDKWIGLIYITEYEDIVFIQSIAILESCRSKGFGSQVLESFKNEHLGKRIVLNIEVIDKQANNYQQRVKRKEFYENNGFLPSGFIVKEPGENLEMLIYGSGITKKEIEYMYKNLFGSILGLFIKPEITKIL